MGIVIRKESALEGMNLLAGETGFLVSSIGAKDLHHIFEHMEEKLLLAQELKRAYETNQPIFNEAIQAHLKAMGKAAENAEDVKGAIGSGMGGLHIKMNWSMIDRNHTGMYISGRQFAVMADTARMLEVIYAASTVDSSTNGNLDFTQRITGYTVEDLNRILGDTSLGHNNEINSLYLKREAVLGILFMRNTNPPVKSLSTPEEYIQKYPAACEIILEKMGNRLPVYQRNETKDSVSIDYYGTMIKE